MIWNSIAEQWGQLTSQINANWSKLTAEDLASIDGKKGRLVAKLQERYGISKDDAAVQVYKWLSVVALTHPDSPLSSGMGVPDGRASNE